MPSTTSWRGANARQKIVRDEADRRRLIDGLEQAVVRFGWELVCYVIMGNHLHLLLKTPRPNLGAGMQSFLSGYAIWSGRRWRRIGHLFQGRCRTEMIEDERYYWTVSRYIHLNPFARRSATTRRSGPETDLCSRGAILRAGASRPFAAS